MSSLNLVKGQKLALTKENSTLKVVGFGLGWDEAAPGGKTFDLDATVIVIDDKNKLISEEPESIVCFANLEIAGIKHSGDDLTGGNSADADDEVVTVTLADIAAKAARLVFLVNIYDAAVKGQNFGQVNRAYIRIFNAETGDELYRFDLSEDSSTASGVFAGELYRHDGGWKFNAMGTPVDGTLREIVDAFK